MFNKVNQEEIYQREIDKYKKDGEKFTIYYKVGFITIDGLTDDDIDYQIDRYKKALDFFESGKNRARYEIFKQYKTIRRKEKILNIKNKINI